MSRQPWNFALAVFLSSVVTFYCHSKIKADEDPVGRIPVREVTVFKDGHAFVHHAGIMPVASDGGVHLTQIPTPVLGTFWPASLEPRAKLAGVAVGQERVIHQQTVTDLPGLLEANIGRQILVHEEKNTWAATIVGIPTRSAAELEKLSGESAPLLAEKGGLIMLKTEEGTRVFPIERLQNITFVEDPRQTIEREQLRETMSLHLDWEGAPGQQVNIGLTYLQRGLRWIPQYRVTLQDDGQARIELQATLVNDLIDLQDVQLNLVIGVPSFKFKDTLDPISLGRTLNDLSVYFQEHESSMTSNLLSNSMMTQTQGTRMSEVRQGAAGGAADGDVPGIQGQEEDLFIFSVEQITLKKRGRMSLAVASWTVPYEDLYRLVIPAIPPMEYRQQNFNSTQQEELARLMTAPKVKHVVRLKNNTDSPLTTAPVVFMQEGRLLSQGMMTYSSRGSSADVEMTTAVNIPVAFEDQETKRLSYQENGSTFERIEQHGTIRLTNFHDHPVTVEIGRYVFGFGDDATAEGTLSKLDPMAQSSANLWSYGGYGGYNYRLNPVTRLSWTKNLQGAEPITLEYNWHYIIHR